MRPKGGNGHNGHIPLPFGMRHILGAIWPLGNYVAPGPSPCMCVHVVQLLGIFDHPQGGRKSHEGTPATLGGSLVEPHCRCQGHWRSTVTCGGHWGFHTVKFWRHWKSSITPCGHSCTTPERSRSQGRTPLPVLWVLVASHKRARGHWKTLTTFGGPQPPPGRRGGRS